MKCEKIEEKISLYMDKQLDWKEEKEFINHIRQCPRCKEQLEQAQQLRKMLLEIPMEEVPKELHENIMAVIEKKVKNQNKTTSLSSKKKKTMLWYRYGAIAASFLLVIAAGNYIYKGIEQKQAVTEELMEKTVDTANVQSASPPMQVQTQQVTAPMQETIEQITQAPITSKALPATPTEVSEEETTEEETSEKDAAQNSTDTTLTEDITTENQQTDTTEETTKDSNTSEQLSTEATTEEPVLMKAALTAEDTSEETQEQEDINVATVSGNSARSIPANMKSKSMKMSLKTKDVQKMAEEIAKKAKQLQGSVQAEYEQNSITIQVPYSRYEDALNWIEQQGETGEKEEVTEDLAKQYKEIQKQAEQAKKIEKDATEKGQTKRAKQAQKTIQEYEAALKQLENTAKFSTIEITLIEG